MYRLGGNKLGSTTKLSITKTPALQGRGFLCAEIFYFNQVQSNAKLYTLGEGNIILCATGVGLVAENKTQQQDGIDP